VSLKDRHFYGVGATACAVCCAAPLLTLLGVAGTAATIATFAFAGIVFGLVVATATTLAVWQQRRKRHQESCAQIHTPIGVELAPTRTGGDA
jgi:hypothetical protein